MSYLRLHPHVSYGMVGGRPVFLDVSRDRYLALDPAAEATFARAYGVDITGLPAENFLTPGRLAELDQQLGIAWSLIRPFRGWRWTVRWGSGAGPRPGGCWGSP